MEVQDGRERKALTIALAIGLFVVIVVIGSIGVAVADSAFDWSDGLTDVLRYAVFGVAGGAMAIYLGRARR